MDEIETFLSQNKLADMQGDMFIEHRRWQEHIVEEATLSKQAIDAMSSWNEVTVTAPLAYKTGDTFKKTLVKGCLYSTGEKHPQLVSLFAYEPTNDEIDTTHYIDLRWIFPNGAISARICDIYGLGASAPVQHRVFVSSHVAPAPRNVAVQEQCGQGWIGNVLWLRYTARREYIMTRGPLGLKGIWGLPTKYDKLQAYQINETKVLSLSFFKELSEIGLYSTLKDESDTGTDVVQE
ncbi:hypothetical protein BKA70DRAFT_1230833 [Coprinopsis sp. MPI-PUGE-AT-0042]|nr:hypothetical protein BKA70DRAFT_1230833 [Coprinopsis sp. MPI-PUGE-AT-0042]